MYKILVADDEPIERAVVDKIINLNLGGALEVVLASNGREAIEKFESENCQIALLDISMPGVDGLDAAARIRAKYKDAILIFLTAYDEFDYARRAITVRAMDFLLKPVDERELITVLDEAIDRLDGNDGQGLFMGGHIVITNELIADGRQEAIRKKIHDYIEENYMRDISLTDVATHLRYSDAYFSKVFKNCFSKGFVLYLTDLRIEKAKEMLGDISANIKDVSAKTGFRDANYFAKVFKRQVGITPSEYQVLRCRNES